MEKRLHVNFRAFVVVAIAVVASVLCVYVYMLNAAAGVVCGCLSISATIVGFVVCLIKTLRGKIKLRVAIALGIAVALSLCAFIVGVVSYENRNDCADRSGYRLVSGRVCAIDTRSGSYRLELEDISFDGKRASGKMLLSLERSDNNIAEFVDCGDILLFSAEIKHEKLISGGYVNGYNYRTDLRYSAKVRPDAIKAEWGEPDPIERFLSSVRRLLTENMGDRYGNIAFSMLTGDKHSLYADITDYYSAAGLGHIMAVSGLHIGFLIMLLSFLLARVDKRIKLPIMTVVIVGYTVIADFSPSVVRAAIMAVIAGSALLCGGRRDILSALSCAFSCILAVKPLYLFDVGFLLSFGAILGIAMFANTIKQSMIRHNIHGKIGDAVGASVAVTLGIIPPEICFFGKFSVIAVIANIVLLPFVSAVFIVTLCILPIAAIPGCGQLLSASKWMFTALDYMVYGIAQIPFAAVSLKTGAGVFLCYPIMFFASDFFMPKRGKPIIAAYSAAACAAIIAVYAL